jgi:thymidine phosphorylase
VREGDKVSKGQPLFELHADDEAHLATGRVTIAHAVVLGSAPRAAATLLLDLIDE